MALAKYPTFLRFHEIPVAKFSNCHCVASSLTCARGIAAFRDLFQFVAGNVASLIWRESAHVTENKTTSAALPISVLHKVGGNAARLHANAKALYRAVAAVPHKHVLRLR